MARPLMLSFALQGCCSRTAIRSLPLRVCSERALSSTKVVRLVPLSPRNQRGYATHTERPGYTSRATEELFSKLEAEAAARRAKGAFSDRDTVGPFPLGVGASGRNKTWKTWGELGLGGKLWRTTQQTGNLTVIVVGVGLFAILAFALTTELFAKNSPSVLYSQAVDLIRASDALNPHLLPPLTFTHSAQSSAPVRGSPPLAHRFVRHPISGRDHLLLTFYVHGRGKDEPEPLGWARRYYHTLEAYVREGALALGLIVPPEQPEQEAEKPVGQKPTEERGSGWWGGLKNSLRPQFTTAPVGRKERGVLPPGTYKIGEVRADYVKNASGQFQLLSLVIDIPNSKASYPSRAVVFSSPEAATEGLLGRTR